MENIYTKKEFIEEKWNFFPFKKKKDDIKEDDNDIANKIIFYLLKNFDEKNYKYEYVYKRYPNSKITHDSDENTYTYIIKSDKYKEIDPLGEEDWEDEKNDDLTIEISKSVNEETKEILINDVPLKISNKKFNKIFNILSEPEENKKRIREQKKEEERILKLKEEEEKKKLGEEKRRRIEIENRKKKEEIRKKIMKKIG